MAGELNITVGSRYAKAGSELPNRQSSKAVDVSGTLVFHKIVSIGTDEVQIDTTGFTLTGFLHIINNASANYVEYGGETTEYCGVAKAGEPSLMRMNNWTGLFLKSDTAASVCEIRVYSD